MSDPFVLEAVTLSLKNLAQRQRVVAGNIANSETPGFKALDVAAPDFSKLVDAQSTARPLSIGTPRVDLTSTMILLGARPISDPGVIIDRDVTETKPDGNNITLEDQLLKLGNIQADYAATANIGSKLEGLIKTAIGRPGS
jgi:flagellar basal-body rod protein FlgB